MLDDSVRDRTQDTHDRAGEGERAYHSGLTEIRRIIEFPEADDSRLRIPDDRQSEWKEKEI